MPNPYLLAADNNPTLLPLLRANPALAAQQDEHGYSLIHAAASYNHLDLLRTLVREFNVDVDLRDEDNETALFVVETIDAAKVLVEELGADPLAKGIDGFTAREKIVEDGDFPEVAEYLDTAERTRAGSLTNGQSANASPHGAVSSIPPLPAGMRITMNAMEPAESNDVEVDPEFRRRIEQLAQRDDFDSETGQAELRQLVQDALADQSTADRNVRPRQS